MKTTGKYFPNIVSSFFVLLFIYASASKMLDFENFQVQLAQSPLLSAYAGFISEAVIFLELVIAGLLCFHLTRRGGLFASFAIMVAFTVYIYLILHYSDFVPCSCGGILEKMTWQQHLVFNIVCVLFALTGIVFIGKERAYRWSRTAAVLSFTAVLSAGSMVALFLSSEYIMKKENNFTRRFPHHPILEEQAYDLKVNSYYFAGSHNSDIYLGNVSSPFRLFKIDTQFKKMDTIDIVPGTNHRFQNLRYAVHKGTLYAYDGTVPVIYAASVYALKNPLFEMSVNEVYFDQLVPIAPTEYVMRVEDKSTKRTALASLSLFPKTKVYISNSVLTRKADGGFDADGRLLYDASSGHLYYLFYYRNQILQLDNNLKINAQMKTIDTISKSQIQTTTLRDGTKKMSAPPVVVNKEMTVHQGLIFNQSSLIGKHESKDTWRKSAVVDIYTTVPAGYWGSMYVQHRGKNRMSQMLVTDTHFFVLSGNEIVRYRFAQTLTENFMSGRSRKPISE